MLTAFPVHASPPHLPAHPGPGHSRTGHSHTCVQVRADTRAHETHQRDTRTRRSPFGSTRAPQTSCPHGNHTHTHACVRRKSGRADRQDSEPGEGRDGAERGWEEAAGRWAKFPKHICFWSSCTLGYMADPPLYGLGTLSSPPQGCSASAGSPR